MAGTTGRGTGHRGTERLTTETKHAFKTTEFVAYVVITILVLLSAMLIKGGDTEGTDEFIARHAWLYVTILTVGYMISRGLAKAGSREPYWGGGTNESRDRDPRDDQ